MVVCVSWVLREPWSAMRLSLTLEKRSILAPGLEKRIDI